MNPYKVLGLHAQASNDEIADRRRLLLRRNHPDRGGDADTFSAIGKAASLIATEADRETWTLRNLSRVGVSWCAKCSGAGAKKRTKGWKLLGWEACKECEGCGLTGPIA